jgi:hypothetical protein
LELALLLEEQDRKAASHIGRLLGGDGDLGGTVTG